MCPSLWLKCGPISRWVSGVADWWVRCGLRGEEQKNTDGRKVIITEPQETVADIPKMRSSRWCGKNRGLEQRRLHASKARTPQLFPILRPRVRRPHGIRTNPTVSSEHPGSTEGPIIWNIPLPVVKVLQPPSRVDWMDQAPDCKCRTTHDETWRRWGRMGWGQWVHVGWLDLGNVEGRVNPHGPW